MMVSPPLPHVGKHASVLTTAYDVDDELWNIASSEDDYLGFDHPDRTRSLRNGVGDLFLH